MASGRHLAADIVVTATGKVTTPIDQVLTEPGLEAAGERNNALGMLRFERGRYAEAEPPLMRALALREKALNM